MLFFENYVFNFHTMKQVKIKKLVQNESIKNKQILMREKRSNDKTHELVHAN